MGGLLQLGQRHQHHACVSGVIRHVYVANFGIQQNGYNIEVGMRDGIVHGCVALKIEEVCNAKLSKQFINEKHTFLSDRFTQYSSNGTDRDSK